LNYALNDSWILICLAVKKKKFLIFPKRAEQFWIQLSLLFDRKGDYFPTSEANHSNLLVQSLRMNGAIDSRPRHTHTPSCYAQGNLNYTITLVRVFQEAIVRTSKISHVLVALELPLQISLNFNFLLNLLFILHANCIKLLKPTGHVTHQQFNIQQLYALPTLYLCVLYLSQKKQRLVPLTA
jgi:hypothetical protein